MSARDLLLDTVIRPGEGKALELRRGQVLRIEQIADGGQCADFNCFNLHDYKEYFHTGRTRHMHGLHPTVGALLWSAPPRERPMAAIIADTVGTNDILYPRCSSFLFEYQYGLTPHTNCHDIQAEAQREFGLTPDDVHDSFNFFMHTGVDERGHPFIAENTATKGDYVELIALMDILAVPNVCGADVMATSSFELKPLRVAVFAGTDEDLAQFDGRREMGTFASQRTPAEFKVAAIKVERELVRDESYTPEFTNVPLVVEDVAVELDDDEAAMLDQLVDDGRFGSTDAEVLRYAFHGWWIHNFMQGPKHFSREAVEGEDLT